MDLSPFLPGQKSLFLRQLGFTLLYPAPPLPLAQLALLEAEAKGEDWKSLGLDDAPHFIERDGSVQVPTKWRYILQRAKDSIDQEPTSNGS